MAEPTRSEARPPREPRSARAVEENPSAATILVVDAEPLARETLAGLLAEHGYEVRAAADAQEAFRSLHEVDLVLLDALLPGTDGWTLCREIKDRIDPHLPIIMVTARTAPEDVVRTFEAGADDYVPKPFQVAELRARIDSRLRAHRAEMALQAANRQASKLAEQNYRLYEQARADAEHRDALLRELDHRVRNNLSVIMGLVTLERTDTASGSAEASLLRLENRLRAFLLAYEAFRRSNYRGVPLKEILDRILQRLRNSLRPRAPITVSVSGDDGLVPERLGFALALAVNELGSQAFRDGFPDGRGGLVAAGVVISDQTLELTIEDDGVARDDLDRAEAQLNGGSVLRTLVEGELGGQVDFDPTAQGSHVRISCPVDREEVR